MLDPWTALSLAACIAQFIDFGTKLVADAKEIRESGSPSNVLDLSNVTADLVSISNSIQDNFSARPACPPPRDAEEVGSRRKPNWIAG
jgi:hypothetical protein